MNLKSAAGIGLLAAVFLCGAPVFQAGGASDEPFTLENGLFSLNIVRECLASFGKLTAEAKGKVSAEKLTQIGNTGWEMQTLGFHNHPGYIEGTLLRQRRDIARLAWELAGLKVKSGAEDEAGVLSARKTLDEATRAFEEFKARFRIKD